MKTLAMVVLLLSAVPGHARDVEFTADVWEHEAKKALLDAGFACTDAWGDGVKKFVTLGPSETRDPLSIINALPTRAERAATAAQSRAAMLNELAAIEAKDDAGTALTATEQRRFRKLVLKLNGWAKRP